MTICKHLKGLWSLLTTEEVYSGGWLLLVASIGSSTPSSSNALKVGEVLIGYE